VLVQQFDAFTMKSWEIVHIAPCLFIHVSALTTQELLNRFSWYLMLGSFIEICQHFSILVKIGQEVLVLYMKLISGLVSDIAC
jgi:hypothetical protein